MLKLSHKSKGGEFMKTNILKNSILAICLCSILLLSSIGFALLISNKAFAEENSENEPYFYSQLKTDLSKNFYKSISAMESEGSLANGTSEYDLIKHNVLTTAQVESYQNGSSYLLKEYGSARDAYIMDNAGNFYTDFSNLSISLGTQNGKYIATLGTGRTDNYYISGGFISATEIAQAKTALTQKITDLLGDYSTLSDYEKIELANKAVSSNVSYSFCNDSAKIQYAPYIRTAYGALINGYAVCEGYARALKILLDEMSINNVLVYGFLLSNEGAFEAHMWNYVELDNKWYAIDSTLNARNGEKYCFLKGTDEFDYDHFAEGKISAADFEFNYPILSKYSYGAETLPTIVTYDQERMLNVTVSYNGKSATELAKDGLYISYCYSEQTSTAGNIVWRDYASLSEVNKLQMFPEGVYIETATETTIKDWGSAPYIKFAVINKAPDGDFGKYATLSTEDIICESDTITNEAYRGIVAAPFAYQVTPQNYGKLDINKTYHITLKYNEQLVKTDTNDVTINVASTHGATSDEYSLRNVVWNAETNEISFDFRPSKMFLHNGEGYNFTPSNLVGEGSRLTPHAVSFSFQYSSIVCNKILDDGRLYMDVYGHPTLIDNSDLSMNGWELNGEPVGQNQRSQLALVITNTSAEDTQEMKSSIAETAELSDESKILSAQTYEIDLDLCGFLKQVPSGSYMKVSFGFPQGYSAKDAGVTFKIYHFKRDANGNIDPSKTVEIPCVITEYGLIAEINDFSPFAVVALPDSEATQTKSIYSRTIGANGSVKVSGTNRNLALLASGETVTFDVTADSGYKVDYVLLNNREIKVVDNKIELSYNDLKSDNVLETAFVAERVADYESTNGIVNLQKDFNKNLNSPAQTGLSTAAIISLVVLAVLIVVFGVIVLLNYKKSQKNKQK